MSLLIFSITSLLLKHTRQKRFCFFRSCLSPSHPTPPTLCSEKRYRRVNRVPAGLPTFLPARNRRIGAHYDLTVASSAASTCQTRPSRKVAKRRGSQISKTSTRAHRYRLRVKLKTFINELGEAREGRWKQT